MENLSRYAHSLSEAVLCWRRGVENRGRGVRGKGRKVRFPSLHHPLLHCPLHLFCLLQACCISNVTLSSVVVRGWPIQSSWFYVFCGILRSRSGGYSWDVVLCVSGVMSVALRRAGSRHSVQQKGKKRRGLGRGEMREETSSVRVVKWGKIKRTINFYIYIAICDQNEYRTFIYNIYM